MFTWPILVVAEVANFAFNTKGNVSREQDCCADCGGVGVARSGGTTYLPAWQSKTHHR